MDSSQITKEQASKLHDALFPHVNYYLRLKERLAALGFPADDPLRVAADEAYQAAWKLSQRAYHLSVWTWDGKLR